MANFTEAFNRTVKKEGGYDADRDDRGNWNTGIVGVGILAGTIMGITCWEVGEYLKKPKLTYRYKDSSGKERSVTAYNVTPSDVVNFPISAIEDIYKKKYWDKMKGDQITNQDFANKIFDFGVNVGIVTGIKQWQRSLGLPETGVMDEATLKATNV